MIWAVAALACGTLIAFINAETTGKMAKKSTNAVLAFFLVRQFVNFGFLALVFLACRKFDLDMAPVLLGAATGLTVPAVILAIRAANKMKKGDDE